MGELLEKEIEFTISKDGLQLGETFSNTEYIEELDVSASYWLEKPIEPEMQDMAVQTFDFIEREMRFLFFFLKYSDTQSQDAINTALARVEHTEIKDDPSERARTVSVSLAESGDATPLREWAADVLKVLSDYLDQDVLVTIQNDFGIDLGLSGPSLTERSGPSAGGLGRG